MRMDLAHFGGPGYAHVLSNIVPRLRAGGMPDESLAALLTHNPARLLAMAAPDGTLVSASTWPAPVPS